MMSNCILDIPPSHFHFSESGWVIPAFIHQNKVTKAKVTYSTYIIASPGIVSALLYLTLAAGMNVVFNFLGHSKIALNDFCVVISIP